MRRSRNLTDGSNPDDGENPDESVDGSSATLDKNGLSLDGSGEFDILITGTLKSEGTPILISDTVTPNNVSITVWKIENPVEVDGDGDGETEEHVVLEKRAGEAPVVTDDSKTIEEKINYIIKIEPSQEDMIELDGTSRIQSHDEEFDVAKEEAKVTLKINVPAGYTLKGAYNGKGEKIQLTKDEHGNYFVTVPRGGGVFLGAELEKNSVPSGGGAADWDVSWYLPSGSGTPRSEEKEKPAETDEKEPVIIFDLNGGMLAGTAGPIMVKGEIGKAFALLDAPTKAGAEFLRWRSLSPDITASAPGETFVVKHGVTFVAVWSDDDASRWYDDAPGVAPPSGDDDDDGPDVTDTVHINTDSDEEQDIGSLTVEKDNTLGVEITANGELDVDRGITVKGETGATGISVSADGRAVKAEVETGDGMNVTASNGPAVGISASASNSGSVDLEFEGDISVSGSGGSTGIQATADGGSKVTIAVEGDLQVE